jgi:uncharacterized protein (DUF1015 family)
MPLIRPFCGLRPKSEYAQKLAAPPYDVIDSAQARERAKDNPYCFLRVTKPEIDLDPGIDPYDAAVYAKGAENLAWLRKSEVLIQDEKPGFYVYEQIMGAHRQVGLVACASVNAYLEGRIKKHENTQPDKVQDRARLMEALKMQTGPVFLCYRRRPEVSALLAKAVNAKPLYDFVGDYSVRHILYHIEDETLVQNLQQSFEGIDALYIADGHHRSEAAKEVCLKLRKENPHFTGEEEFNYFLSVIFPDDQMLIMPYNRAVRDLNGLTPMAFLTALEPHFGVHAIKAEWYTPEQSHVIGVYLRDRWFALSAQADNTDPVGQLDAAILQDKVLQPILGIADPRTDKRIKFVGGMDSVAEIKRLTDSGEFAVAFSLFPTSMQQVMQVADAGQMMPPKSTWFEPKLLSGLVTHALA